MSYEKRMPLIGSCGATRWRRTTTWTVRISAFQRGQGGEEGGGEAVRISIGEVTSVAAVSSRASVVKALLAPTQPVSEP